MITAFSSLIKMKYMENECVAFFEPCSVILGKVKKRLLISNLKYVLMML